MIRRERRSTAYLPGQRSEPAGQLDRALSKLQAIVLDGLRHGFFECTVIGQTKDRKRSLLIKAGNSYQFVIAAEELGQVD